MNKCNKPNLLREFLINVGGIHEIKSSGQHIFRLKSGLIVNVYDTGTYTFQGSNTAGEFAQRINNFAQKLNES